MTTGAVIFEVTTFSTVFCTAVNCYTFRLAYPLWRFVGPEFPAVHREYLRRLNAVITVPHVVMFFASPGLIHSRPAFLSLAQAWSVFALNAAVVIISAFVAGPVHTRFTRTGMADEPGLGRLIRVSAWRSVLMLTSCAILGCSAAGAL